MRYLAMCLLFSASASPSAAAGVPDRIATLDEMFDDVALREKFFAGMYLDGDQLVIATTAVGREHYARNAVEQVFGGRLTRRSSPRFTQVRNSWRSLSEWKRSLKDIFGNPAVTKLDANERENAIVVGVDDPLQIGNVSEYVASRGVPLDAVRYEYMEATHPTATLRDSVRPVAGGTQIEIWNGGFCSFGFTAVDANGNVAGVTSGHCTRNIGINDYDEFNQPTWALFGLNYIGRELVDPALRTDLPGCPSNFICRWSDSILTDGEASGADHYQGRIMRTTGFGSITIADIVAFRIERLESRPLAGEELHRIGRTTGWQKGIVTTTCADLPQAGTSIMFLCQSIHSAASAGGDSGSPVFSFAEPAVFTEAVTLNGLHWGANSSGSVFSPMDNLERDLGPLNACSTGFSRCSTSTTRGDATCTLLSSDASNCGFCGNVCASGQVCVTGLCKVPDPPATSCSPGMIDCCDDGRYCRADYYKCPPECQ